MEVVVVVGGTPACDTGQLNGRQASAWLRRAVSEETS